MTHITQTRAVELAKKFLDRPIASDEALLFAEAAIADYLSQQGEAVGYVFAGHGLDYVGCVISAKPQPDYVPVYAACPPQPMNKHRAMCPECGVGLMLEDEPVNQMLVEALKEAESNCKGCCPSKADSFRAAIAAAESAPKDGDGEQPLTNADYRALLDVMPVAAQGEKK